MNWKKYFDEKILTRGLDYYNKGKVADYFDDGENISATVSGSEAYTVNIAYKGVALIEMDCDCPHSDSGNYCKHMAAVLFYHDLGEREPKKSASKKKTSAPSKPEKSAKPSSAEIISEAFEKNLSAVREFLTEKCNSDEKFLNDFIAHFAPQYLSLDIKTLKKNARKIFSKHRSSGFIDYWEAAECCAELCEELDNNGSIFLKAGDYRSAVDYALYVLDYLEGQEMDDDGGISEVCDSCKTLMVSAAEISRESRRYAFSALCDKLDYCRDFAYDVIWDIIFSPTFGVEFSDKKLSLLDGIIERKTDKKSYYEYERENAVNLRIDLMLEYGFDENEVLSFVEKHINYVGVQRKYIELLTKMRQTDCAIAFLKQRQKSKTESGLSPSECSELLVKIYKDKNDREQYKNQLFDLMTIYSGFSIENFIEYKSMIPEDLWQEEFERFLSCAMLSKSEAAELYAYEKMYEKLIEVIESSGNSSLLQKYIDILSPEYDDFIVRKSLDFISDEINHATNRETYRSIVVSLRKVTKFNGGKEAVGNLVADWRIRFRNRRALMEELDKIVL